MWTSTTYNHSLMISRVCRNVQLRALRDIAAAPIDVRYIHFNKKIFCFDQDQKVS
jgi:hypothetical protein